MDERYPTDQCEAPQPMGRPMGMTKEMCEKRDPRRTKELLGIAETIAAIVESQTRRNERCKLRRMVEMFLDVE